jgi:hypothetical protein
MRTLHAILEEEETSGRLRARKKWQSINQRNSLFTIVMYVSLGSNKSIHGAVVKKTQK